MEDEQQNDVEEDHQQNDVEEDEQQNNVEEDEQQNDVEEDEQQNDVEEDEKWITGEEYLAATTCWIRDAQKALRTDSKFEQTCKQLRLFKDGKGLWRCGGRIQKSDLPHNMIHPYLIPKNNKLSELIVKKAHENVMHKGLRETLNSIATKRILDYTTQKLYQARH